MPLTGRLALEPSGSGGAAREGEITSAHTQAVGEGWGVLLKGYQERIWGRDLVGRGGGITGHVGTSNVTTLQKVIASNVTLGKVPNATLASDMDK